MSTEKMGFDEEMENEDAVTETVAESDKVVEFEKPKRKPFAYWEVGGKRYKLKLTTETICKLDEKFKGNLINLISGGTLPRLDIMLTVTQAAMKKWHHGIKYKDVQNLFDKYLEEGGSQIAFLTGVIMPIMTVSGFFTPDQAEEIEQGMEDLE